MSFVSLYAVTYLISVCSVSCNKGDEKGWNGGVVSLPDIQRIKQSIQTHVHSRRVQSGSNVKFDCAHDATNLLFHRGYETVKTYWLHNNDSFDSGLRKRTYSYIGEIQDAQPADNGVYTCHVKYPNEKPRVIRLEALIVDTLDATLEVWEGGSMDLSCNSAYALVHLEGFWVRWLHNSSIYAERKSTVWLYNNLHVYPITAESNGVWQCVLVNDVGKMWWTGRYVVRVHYARVFALEDFVQALPDYLLAALNVLIVVSLFLFTCFSINIPRKKPHYGRSLYTYYDWRNSWRHGSSTVSLDDRKLDFKEFKELFKSKKGTKGASALMGMK